MALPKDILSLQQSFEKDQVIFSENDLTRDLYVLLKGKVNVIQKGISLAVLDKPGAFLGEMALLSGQPRSATLIALDLVVMLKVPPEKIPVMLKHMPDLIMKIAKNLAATVGNLNKEMLKARESVSLVELLKKELDDTPQSSLEDVVPKLFKEVQQHQHESMLEVAKSYLTSHVFIDPFISSIERTLKIFFPHAIKVTRDDPKTLEIPDRVCGTDFLGAMSGTFLFMAPSQELSNIGKKLFGDKNNEASENDTLMELTRKIIESVKTAVPGLHLEISHPELLENFAPTDDFIGLKLTSETGFKSWVYLNP